jgi:plastocyanin
MTRGRVLVLVAAAAAVATVPGIVALGGSARAAPKPKQVVVPQADQFTPFALTVHSGDAVQWVNNDTDNHTVVSDDPFNTAGHQGTNQLLVGTDANGGKAGVFTLRFNHPGTFVYYCRFHAKLDAANQPIAPGPDGGIQDANGNFGTPMMGIITVRD